MSSRLRSLRLATVLARVNKRKRAAKKKEEGSGRPKGKPALRLVPATEEPADDTPPRRT